MNLTYRKIFNFVLLALATPFFLGCPSVPGLDNPGPWTVTAIPTNVYLAPYYTQLVRNGEGASFIVVPMTGYPIIHTVVSTCPAGTWDDDVYTTGAITENCTLTFTAGISLTVVPTAHGSVSANVGLIENCTSTGGVCTDLYPEDAIIELSTTPAAGYYVPWSVANCAGDDCQLAPLSGTTVVPVAFTADPDALYLYSTDNDFEGDVGTHAVTDDECEDTYNRRNSAPGWNMNNVSCTNFVSVLGYAATDGVRDLIKHPYNIPTGIPIEAVDGTAISDEWDEFIADQIPASLPDLSGFMQTTVWTGVQPGGHADPGNNCTNFSSNGVFGGWVDLDYDDGGGPPTPLPSDWDRNSGSCALEHGYLCLCW